MLTPCSVNVTLVKSGVTGVIVTFSAFCVKRMDEAVGPQPDDVEGPGALAIPLGADFCSNISPTRHKIDFAIKNMRGSRFPGVL
jgi:hypothetical protein